MLLLDRLGRPQSDAEMGADRLDLGRGQRFVLGGVEFELLASSPRSRRGLALEPDALRYCLPVATHPAVADVLCAVSIDDAFFEHASPYGGLELCDGAFADLDHGEIELRAPRVQATLCRIGPQRYACSARIASAPRALTSLLQSIVAVVAHASGGAVLHAAGVELSGRAVIYVGPSGAGKSTAAALTEGARMFACDRVALIPQPDGRVLAYGMPGGKGAAMPYTDRVVWPLAGVYRILRHGASAPLPHVPRARLADDIEGVFVVRGAIETADISAAAEESRLSAASSIAKAVKVGTLHTVLGMPHAALVREQLGLARGTRA